MNSEPGPQTQPEQPGITETPWDNLSDINLETAIPTTPETNPAEAPAEVPAQEPISPTTESPLVTEAPQSAAAEVAPPAPEAALPTLPEQPTAADTYRSPAAIAVEGLKDHINQVVDTGRVNLANRRVETAENAASAFEKPHSDLTEAVAERSAERTEREYQRQAEAAMLANAARERKQKRISDREVSREQSLANREIRNIDRREATEQSAMDKLIGEQAKDNAKRKELGEKISDKRDAIDSRRQELADLESEKSTLEASLEQTDISKLKQNLAAARTRQRKQSLRREIKHADATSESIASLDLEIAEIKGEIAKLNTEIDGLKSARNAILESMDRRRDESDERVGNIRALDDERVTINNRLESVKQRTNLDREVESATSEEHLEELRTNYSSEIVAMGNLAIASRGDRIRGRISRFTEAIRDKISGKIDEVRLGYSQWSKDRYATNLEAAKEQQADATFREVINSAEREHRETQRNIEITQMANEAADRKGARLRDKKITEADRAYQAELIALNKNDKSKEKAATDLSVQISETDYRLAEIPEELEALDIDAADAKDQISEISDEKVMSLSEEEVKASKEDLEAKLAVARTKSRKKHLRAEIARLQDSLEDKQANLGEIAVLEAELDEIADAKVSLGEERSSLEALRAELAKQEAEQDAEDEARYEQLLKLEQAHDDRLAAINQEFLSDSKARTDNLERLKRDYAKEALAIGQLMIESSTTKTRDRIASAIQRISSRFNTNNQ